MQTYTQDNRKNFGRRKEDRSIWLFIRSLVTDPPTCGDCAEAKLKALVALLSGRFAELLSAVSRRK